VGHIKRHKTCKTSDLKHKREAEIHSKLAGAHKERLQAHVQTRNRLNQHPITNTSSNTEAKGRSRHLSTMTESTSAVLFIFFYNTPPHTPNTL